MHANFARKQGFSISSIASDSRCKQNVAMRYAETGKRAVDFSSLPANCKGEVLEPNVDEKIQSYASSLDKSQKNEDDSLGVLFAQKVKIKCE